MTEHRTRPPCPPENKRHVLRGGPDNLGAIGLTLGRVALSGVGAGELSEGGMCVM